MDTIDRIKSLREDNDINKSISDSQNFKCRSKDIF